VPATRCFTGFDNYQHVCALPDVNLIVTAAPPGFRPLHLKAAVEAGKHVFMEKPVAVDPVGVRSVIASSDLAAQKHLAIVAGTQRRHQARYVEMLKRIHDGQIGEIVAASATGTWATSGSRSVPRHVGDGVAVPQLALLHLALGRPHRRAARPQHRRGQLGDGRAAEERHGMGGRQARTRPEFGNIYDHFAVEYEYPNGVRAISLCRQTQGAAERVEERIVGTKGVA